MVVTQIQAKQVFDRHYTNARRSLYFYETCTDKNGAITHFYQEMVMKYPAMQWFGIAASASAAVGKGIAYTDSEALRVLEGIGDVSIIPVPRCIAEINNVHKVLCDGNIGIFKNIFAVWHTYYELGISGLKQVQAYDLEHEYQETVTQEVIDAFSGIEELMHNDSVISAFSEYRRSQELGTSGTFALDPQAAAVLEEIALNVTKHEQSIVNVMYEKKINDRETMGDMLNSAVQNPVIAFVFDKLQLFGPTIAEKYIPFTSEHGDISSFEDRMKYFEKDLSSTYFNALKTPGGADLLIKTGNELVADEGIWYVHPAVTHRYHENPLFFNVEPQIESIQEAGDLFRDLFNVISDYVGNAAEMLRDPLIPEKSENITKDDDVQDVNNPQNHSENQAISNLQTHEGILESEMSDEHVCRQLLFSLENEQTMLVSTPSMPLNPIEEMRVPDFMGYHQEPVDLHSFF